MKNKISIQQITMMALMVALICASAFISIPLPFSEVPLTAQTLIVNLIGMIFGPVEAFLTIFAYVLLGLCGLPVFSGGMGGPAKLFGPTGGYIISWIMAVVVISLLKGRKYNMLRYCIVSIAVSFIIIYGIGTAFFKFQMNMSWNASLMMCVYPYIPLDIAKCIAASAIAKPIRLLMVHFKQENGTA